MSFKSSRGIQEQDVYQAADALIAEGLRPTIERVRQKIGRGSPNTVSPLLDAWFGTLSARLGLDGAAKEEGGQLPEPVQQAAILLWDTALSSARQEATQALEHNRQSLDAERTALAQQIADFEHHRQALAARQLACDEALQMARSQLEEKNARLEAAGIRLQRQEREIDELHEKLKIREQEREAGLRRSEEEAQRHAQERLRLEARAAANERRLLQDLDREREDTKRSKAALAEQKRGATAVHARLETANLNLAAQLQEKEHAFKAVHQTLAVADARVNELSDLLEAQKRVHATTLKQLELLLQSSPQRNRAQIPIRRRRV